MNNLRIATDQLIPIRSADWYLTPDHQKRGYIDPQRLKELWFHTGTACNLSCPFCLEGSAPGDKRLQLVKLADVTPFIDEAMALGVEQFSFTRSSSVSAWIITSLSCMTRGGVRAVSIRR